MGFQETWEAYWSMLHSELSPENDGPRNAPLLAHYTSLSNLENILGNNQVWLLNPLFMNDLEEVRFGVNNGVDLVYRSEVLREALGNTVRRNAFYDMIDNCYEQYGSEHVVDLYIMCFSKHDAEKHADGRLSMWRGYGENGKGAAIVFDTSRLSVIESSPLALAPVFYATQEERKSMIDNKITEAAEFIAANDIPDDYVSSCADALFKRICLFAIFSKHTGFLEEDEWRLVYFKDRDPDRLLAPYLSYFNGPSGLQPKLKLDVKPITGATTEGVSLENMIHSIIIGPSATSPLAKLTAHRMLRSLKKESLIPKLTMSTIPYRAD